MKPTIAELEDAVLTRLSYLAGQIEGVQRSIKNAPDEVIPVTDLPCVYTLVRGTLTPSNIAAGQLTVIRQYVQRLLLKPIDLTGVNDTTFGAEVNQMAVPFLSRWELFYAERPNLQHSTRKMLKGCTLFDILDGGIITMPAPGGAPHVGIDFVLSVEMTFRVDAIPSPYEDVED